MTARLPMYVRYQPVEREERKADRFSVSGSSGGAVQVGSLVRDVSKAGFLMDWGAAVVPGRAIAIDLPGIGWRRAEIVRHKDGAVAGRFDRPLNGRELQSVFAASKIIGLPFRKTGLLDRARVQTLQIGVPVDKVQLRLNDPSRRKSLKARMQLILLSSILLWTALIVGFLAFSGSPVIGDDAARSAIGPADR